MEWAIEVALEFGLPVAATMCMGPGGDESGVSAGECAVRMARAGAHIVGTNCLFDPWTLLEVMKEMKDALKLFKLDPYLMAQPNGYRIPDGGSFGWVEIEEFPFAVEPRQITRWEARKWARSAYELGIRYIGGCCGFEPYHIRAMAEELRDVRGGLPESSDKSDWDLSIHKELSVGMPRYKRKGDLDYWMNMHPATGKKIKLTFLRFRVFNYICKLKFRTTFLISILSTTSPGLNAQVCSPVIDERSDNKHHRNQKSSPANFFHY